LRSDGREFRALGDVIMGNGTGDSPPFA